MERREGELGGAREREVERRERGECRGGRNGGRGSAGEKEGKREKGLEGEKGAQRGRVCGVDKETELEMAGSCASVRRDCEVGDGLKEEGRVESRCRGSRDE
ncbi:hypothetical protein Tco_1482553 [Tanacetum coccineum]